MTKIITSLGNTFAFLIGYMGVTFISTIIFDLSLIEFFIISLIGLDICITVRILEAIYNF